MKKNYHQRLEQSKLELVNDGDMIVRFQRVRYFNNVSTIIETICLPLEHFPGFGSEMDPPNNLFRFYQSILWHYGCKS